ncbi:hypothetical protein M408DRAFT_137678 [Serendipita vermifera MAFF 305830]|uniref:Uncharacterized protein n=1 Tax=Serendipita vermifera MAFF 305830 TaxID=933852 RepID=A0A0C3B991_SERVB|nr:hypothetical protein M408DRAFT_137678 [Serendipita vermifera MAFF 305830]
MLPAGNEHDTRLKKDIDQSEKGPVLVPQIAPVPDADQGTLHESLRESGSFIVLLVLDILKSVLKLLKQPIALTLVIYIILVVLSQVSSFMVSLVSLALAPICTMPLLSMVSLCDNGKSPTHSKSIQEPRFQDLVSIQTGFESIMESAGMGINLALNMKKMEIAIRDLNTLVKLSDLVSKDLLSSSLDAFVISAKDASRHLSRLESGVGGAVDSIVAMNDYAINSLEAIEKYEKNKSAISTIIHSTNTSPMSREKIAETFNQAAGVTESNLRRLIEMALATMTILNQIESQLSVIHEIVSREEGDTKAKRDEVVSLIPIYLIYLISVLLKLADLWTYLGANRDKLNRFADHRTLLSQVANYRSAAAMQVGGTLVQLEGLAADLDELRERVATPLLAHETAVPLEVHIETLRKGVQRLTDGRNRAKVKEDAILGVVMDGPQHVGIGQ